MSQIEEGLKLHRTSPKVLQNNMPKYLWSVDFCKNKSVEEMVSFIELVLGGMRVVLLIRTTGVLKPRHESIRGNLG